MKPIKNVTIIGMGALGTLFGCEIQSKIGRENVAFLMDEARCEKNKTAVYKVNGEPFDFRIISPMEAAPADLIIVSTKATGLTEALDTMAPAVGDETIIISAINGVVSEEILADRFGADKVIHAVAQGMDAAFFDRSVTFENPGVFCLGIVDPAMREKLCALTAFFESISFPFRLEEDIMRRIWSKFMLNVGGSWSQPCARPSWPRKSRAFTSPKRTFRTTWTSWPPSRRTPCPRWPRTGSTKSAPRWSSLRARSAGSRRSTGSSSQSTTTSTGRSCGSRRSTDKKDFGLYFFSPVY